MTLIDIASTTTSTITSRLLQIQQIYYQLAKPDYRGGRDIQVEHFANTTSVRDKKLSWL